MPSFTVVDVRNACSSSRDRRAVTAASSAALLVALTSAVAARADVPCADLPNPVFMQIGDTQEGLVKAIGRRLRDSSVMPTTIIYLKASSCVNVEVFESGGVLATNPLYVPSSAEDPAWTPDAPAPSCTIASGGVPLDAANSATFISSCTFEEAPAGVVRRTGPVQAYGFVVPEASTEVAITAAEAYFVYGFGETGQVTPWRDEAFIFKRPTTSSTLLTLMANINVPVDKAKGELLERSGQLITAVQASTAPQKTIGVLGTEIYDRNRATLNILAFRAFQQRLAYFPDSTSTSFDKKNVRDGHYVPWSPTEWMYRETETGEAENPRAKYVVDLIVGHPATPAPDFDALATVIATGLVPLCAMQVMRAFDGGELSVYEPEEPCGCFFESEVDVPSAACVRCDDDAACGAGVCRHGFCEER